MIVLAAVSARVFIHDVNLLVAEERFSATIFRFPASTRDYFPVHYK